MARRPPRQRASGRAPDQTQYVRERKSLFKRVEPDDRSPSLWAIFFTTPYASHLLGKCTTNDRNVLNAIIEVWNYNNRHVNTSINIVRQRLNSSRNSIKNNKISDHLTNLVKIGLIIKDHSGHNDLRIRVNPFVCWKGKFNACNRARANERSEWPSTIDPDE
jgi:hypothetical protein